MRFNNATSLNLRPLRVELKDGSPAVSRGLLGWLLGRGPGVACIAHRWSGAQHRSIAAGPEVAPSSSEGPGELLFDYHRRRRLGLRSVWRLVWLGMFLGGVATLLRHGPQEGLALLGGEAVAGRAVVIAPGDSLGRIAARWNLSVEAIRRANELPNDVIWVGQELILPLDPVPVPMWRTALRARLQGWLTEPAQRMLAQATTVIGWLALLALLSVPLAVVRLRFARHTLWLYDLAPAELTAIGELVSALADASGTGLRTVEGTRVRFEEEGLPMLITTATPAAVVVGGRRLVLLPDRILLDDGEVAHSIHWDEFVLRFPPPDVATGEGLGVANTTLLLKTRLFDAVLTHDNPQVLARLERALQLVRV